MSPVHKRIESDHRVDSRSEWKSERGGMPARRDSRGGIYRTRSVCHDDWEFCFRSLLRCSSAIWKPLILDAKGTSGSDRTYAAPQSHGGTQSWHASHGAGHSQTGKGREYESGSGVTTILNTMFF